MAGGVVVWSVWALVCAVGLHLLLRKEYPVHTSGVIVITGASTGIGRHAAVHLARAGYVVFAGVRSSRDALSIQNENLPHTLLPLILDVTNQTTINSAFDTVSAYLKQNNLFLVGIVNKSGFFYF